MLSGKNSFIGVVLSVMIGAVALIPGFVAFPLAKILIINGVSYKMIAFFLTSLMMVGILTLPIEIKYFGKKAAFMRNAVSFVGAIVIALMMGVFL